MKIIKVNENTFINVEQIASFNHSLTMYSVKMSSGDYFQISKELWEKLVYESNRCSKKITKKGV